MSRKLVDFLFFNSLFSSRLADQLVLFIVPLIVYKSTGSASISGITFFLETLPRFLSFPIAGILCDHLSPYKVIHFSQKTRFTIISLGLIGNFFVDSVYWLIAISAFTGIATSFGAIAREVIIPQAFKHARLEKVMSFTSLSDQLGIVAGPVLAVVLLEFLDWEVVLIIGALLFVLSDLLIKFWNNESAVEIKALNEDKIDIVHSIKVSCGHIIKLNGLLPAIVLAFSINLILGTALASVVPMYTGTYEQGSLSYGVLQAFSAISAMFVLFLIASYKIRIGLLGGIGFIAISIGALMTAFASNYIIYFLGFVLIIAFDKMFNIFVRSLRVKVIPPVELGKTTGLIVLLNNMSQPLAGLIVASFVGFMDLQSIVICLNIAAVLLGLGALTYAVSKVTSW